MAQCGRCGTEAELHVLRPRREDGSRRREKVCGQCFASAHDEQTALMWPKRQPRTGAEEDARWDRIFQKFIDPAYYTGRVPSLPSTFGAFAGQMEVLCRG